MRTANLDRGITVCGMTRDKVKALLGERLVVQGRFAKAAGVDPDKLSRWLNAKGHLWYEELYLIARKLGVPVDYLCDDTQVAPSVAGGPRTGIGYAPTVHPTPSNSERVDKPIKRARRPRKRR